MMMLLLVDCRKCFVVWKPKLIGTGWKAEEHVAGLVDDILSSSLHDHLGQPGHIVL